MKLRRYTKFYLHGFLFSHSRYACFHFIISTIVLVWLNREKYISVFSSLIKNNRRIQRLDHYKLTVNLGLIICSITLTWFCLIYVRSSSSCHFCKLENRSTMLFVNCDHEFFSCYVHCCEMKWRTFSALLLFCFLASSAITAKTSIEF